MRVDQIEHKNINFFLIILLLVMMSWSCGKEKTHIVAKAYHNTTSFFNGYYNANLLIKETERQIDLLYKYPTNKLFKVKYYGTEQEAKTYQTDLAAVIEKNDIVIYKHPNGKWVDDCRFMNGQAWYFQQNYSLAMENYDYVLEKFPESKIIPEVRLWIAKNHYEAGSSELATSVLNEHIIPYLDTLRFDKAAQAELAVFRSQMAIDEQKYDTAAMYLAPAVDLLKGRHYKAKAYFLLGQLYDESDQYPEALVNFEKVAKFSQDYNLAFKSKIAIASLYLKENSDNEGLVKYLKKLLKDEKNVEYQDQIYYQFALMETKQDSLYPAIDYLKQSIAASTSNVPQKAMSYYKTGQIYFLNLQNYEMAQAYYDSAATIIPKDDPYFKEITGIAKTLRDYVLYQNTITYQDSMLMLAEMPKKELEQLIADIIEEEEKKRLEELRLEQERLEKERQQQLANAGGNRSRNPFGNNNPFDPNSQRGGQAGSNFYFDNPTAVSSGIQTFQQKWGQRTNEDNWRRSSKQAAFASGSNDPNNPGQDGGDGSVAGGTGSSPSAPIDSSLVKQYGDKARFYKDIPKTEEEKAIANALIETALYNLGQIYAQKLNEPDSAIKTFEYLLDRYDGTEYTLRARYALYELYKAGDNPIYNVHSNYIVNEHPRTVYAYLIQGLDPNELKESENDFKYAYLGLFSAYRDRQYETALGFSQFLLAQFADNSELNMAELYYIRGMSYGYLGEKDSLVNLLTLVVQNYPDEEVTPVAQKTLNYLNNGLPQGQTSTPMPKDKPSSTPKNNNEDGNLKDPNNPKYAGFGDKLKANDKIFVLMFLENSTVPKNDVTSKVSDFNTKNFSEDRLKVFTFLYKGAHLLPYVSHFGSLDEAKKYITGFNNTPESKELMKGPGDKIFYISHSNFKVAYGKKRMEDYILYYENILK